MKLIGLAALLVASCAPVAPLRADAPPAQVQTATVEAELVARYGPSQAGRIKRGLAQAASLWRAEDGDAEAFRRFVLEQFAGDPAAQDALFSRLEFVIESLEGRMLEIGRDFRWYSELEIGPMIPVDGILAGYDAGAHFVDDAFKNKLAFVVLLNFPMTTLDQRLQEGASWTSRQWAEARLVDRFSARIPAEVNLAVSDATAQAEAYIADYNIWMHHVLDAKGRRLFPAGKRLLSHWNLRDEIKSQYSQGTEGLARQRQIQKVMERIVDQSIPAVVIDNPCVDWDPVANTVRPAAVKDSDKPAPALKVTSAPEPDTRYAKLLEVFRASKKADPYCPAAPTYIARSFEQGRQIPETRVMEMLKEICLSPRTREVARLIEKRLGRRLEPFDIWFNGFRPGADLDEAKLDAITRKRFPTPAAYKAWMPEMLTSLGFTPEKARFLADHIEVDPARGSGHAMQAARRGDHPHLRTRVGKDGMDYKGFNIAVHENGHNVEQVFSLYEVDSPLMASVPNNAFTEALAFVFQARDLELLGQPKPSARARAEAALNDFWMAYEIAGVGMVDTRVWHWMYEHPQATPADLRLATLAIAKDVWNAYYAPVFGQKDCVLLGVYSHMIANSLYLPDYPIGHMIACQIQRQMDKAGNVGSEFERMARQGCLTPDLWMVRATGSPVGPKALLDATGEALAQLK